MSRRRVAIATAAAFTVLVTPTVTLLAHRHRIDCRPGDESCSDSNTADARAYGLFDVVWILGTTTIVSAARVIKRRR